MRMKLSFETKLALYACVLIVINVAILSSSADFTSIGQSPGLDFSKEFANSMVSELQELAIDLTVDENSGVKHALAQLHYDVFLVNSRPELARIIQRDAAAVRRTIIDAYIEQVGEQVLTMLNNSPEVQGMSSNAAITLEPLPEGGLKVTPEDLLSADLQQQLAELETLFSHSSFRSYYETYRAQSVIQVEIEDGSATTVIPATEQVTIEYWEEQIQSLRSEYSRMAQGAGFSETTGAGIVLEFYGLLNAREVRLIVNELFIAGAYAIAVDGQRIAVNGHIMDSDDGIEVNGVLISTDPLVVEALGNASHLQSATLLFDQFLRYYVQYYNLEAAESISLPGKTLE